MKNSLCQRCTTLICAWPVHELTRNEKSLYFTLKLHRFLKKCTKTNLILALSDVTNGTDTPLIDLLYPLRVLHGHLVTFVPFQV